MNDSVSFKSARFRPVLPEECQVNPGRYGAELAFWLCGELVKQGVVTSYPNYEDWGWFLEYTVDSGEEFWLCCGNTDGSDDEWQCFLKPVSRGLFRSTPAPDQAEPLILALMRVLEQADGVTNIDWYQGS